MPDPDARVTGALPRRRFLAVAIAAGGVLLLM
jgi:hypothetical protein